MFSMQMSIRVFALGSDEIISQIKLDDGEYYTVKEVLKANGLDGKLQGRAGRSGTPPDFIGQKKLSAGDYVHVPPASGQHQSSHPTRFSSYSNDFMNRFEADQIIFFRIYPSNPYCQSSTFNCWCVFIIPKDQARIYYYAQVLRSARSVEIA
jgi:hypothetical protein